MVTVAASNWARQAACLPTSFDFEQVDSASVLDAQGILRARNVASRRDDRHVVLSVTDTGIGFDMRYHDRIVWLFKRLHAHVEYLGTRVGLGIVRKAAERHGGRARAVSVPGGGSTLSRSLSANELAVAA